MNPLGRLSRGVAGTRGRALILNVAGFAPTGAVEMLDAVLDVVPHALRADGRRTTRHTPSAELGGRVELGGRISNGRWEFDQPTRGIGGRPCPRRSTPSIANA